MEQIISGGIKIGESSYPYSFDIKTEKIIICIGNRSVSVPEDIDTFVAQKYEAMTGGKTLYKLCVPLSNDCLCVAGDKSAYVSLANQIRPVDYYIDNYEENSLYSEMRFQFPELNYFIPSVGRATVTEEQVIISRLKEELLCFDVEYQNTIVNVSFVSKMSCQCNVKVTTETISEVILTFTETDNIEFIRGLYEIVRCFFAFICNRQNIGLRNVILIGKYPSKAIKDGEIVDVDKFTSQRITFSQKYIEPEENKKIVSKTPNYGLFYEKLPELFRLFSDEVDEYGPVVNGNSVHRSTKHRNLIDLEQSLHITATFEFYIRTLLPEISSQDTLDFFHDLEVFLDKYIEENTGKKKKKAKSFKNGLRPNVSLKEKVLKAYEGYSDWESLKPILSEWFGQDVSSLADSANLWRNELAHEKREYQPDVDVVHAVRLIEHINYCIVLRKAGYTDEQIKNIVSEILTR